MTLSQLDFMSKPRFLLIANHILESTLTNELSILQAFPKLRPPLTLLSKKSFSFKYLFLSIIVHRSVSLLSQNSSDLPVLLITNHKQFIKLNS
jgi:hypothetical protein